jgi:hypothetical protein
MIRQISFKTFALSLLALAVPVLDARAGGDQAKAILNRLDSKSMNELFEISRRQPDAALTNIAPTTPNTFRFLFVWPSSSPMITYDRVVRSFGERFVGFADQMKLLAVGFCLPARNMYFGSAIYGEQEVNVAFRDFEVRYMFGWRPPCVGRYIPISEIEQTLASVTSRGYVATPPLPEAPPPMTTPEESLKPFLNPKPDVPQE